MFILLEAALTTMSRLHSTEGSRPHANRKPWFVLATAVVSVGMFAQTGTPAAAAAPKSASPQTTTVLSSSVYTPLPAPVRLVDGVSITPGAPVNVLVAGGSTSVPANAQSVVVNLASAGNVDAGFLQAYPTGGSTTSAALNQYYANQLQSELATVPVGTGGQITISTHVATHFYVDEEGYYAAAGSGTAGQYKALPPARLTDTRSGGTPLTDGGTIRIQVTGGTSGVPLTGASAAVVNIAALDDTRPGFLQAYPDPANRPMTPQTANVNYNGNSIHSANLPCTPTGALSATSGCDITSNRAIVKLDATGGFTIYANQGPVDLVVDVNGYFTDPTASTGQFFTPTGVSRLFDSRIAGTTLGARETRNLPIAGAGGSNPVIPSGATAAVLSVAIDKTIPNNAAHPFTTGPGLGFLTVFPGPTGSTLPLAADANFAANSIVSTHVYATLGSDGSINIYNGSDAPIDVIVDAYGFFSNFATAPTPFTVTMSPSTTIKTGASTTVTATVKDHNGAAVAGDTVNFTTGTNAACGTVSPTSATTNASGVASTTYTASSTSGACIVTGTEQANGASGTTTITSTNQSYAVSCSPTSATPSTSGAPTQGNLTCSATGLPANATVDLALFPSQGTNAPVNNSGSWTFTPTAGNEAAGIGTTNNGAAGHGAFIETVNGNAQGTNAAGNTTTQVNGVGTGPSGSISFVVNSFVTDGAYAVVWTNSDGDNNLGLDPTTHQPNQPFGISQALSWTSTAAPTGTNGNFFVQSVDHTAGTFVGCPTTGPTAGSNTNTNPTSGCLTFTYSNTGSQAGSAYCYNGAGTTFTGTSACTFAAGHFGISFAQFDSWLSGYTPATPASTQPAGSPGNPSVPGDTILVSSYNAAGPSQFDFVADVPLAPSGLTTTSPSPGTAHLSWTAPSNPDVVNDTDNTAVYGIWRDQTAGTVGTGCAAIGTWVHVANTPGGGAGAPPTTFTDSTSCLAGGGTFSYAVAAQPNGPNGGNSDIGPNSNTSSVTVTATAAAAVLPPVSTSSVLTQGTTVPASTTSTLDNGDTLQFIFRTNDANGNNVSAANPITIATGAQLFFADNYGEQSDVTCGTNATCSVSNGGTQLNIVLTADPHHDNVATATSSSPTQNALNTAVGDAVVSETGIGGPGGAWNLAVSGLPSTPSTLLYPTVTRTFEGTSTTGALINSNSTYSGGSSRPTTNPPGTFCAGVTATVPNQVVLAAGDFNCRGSNSGAQTGDPVTVYNAIGVAIGTGTYNNASGTTISTIPSFNQGDLLYVVYQDTSGRHDKNDDGASNQPSLSLGVGVDNYCFTSPGEPPCPPPSSNLGSNEIAPAGTLANNQNVTVTLSGVTPAGTVYLKFVPAASGGSATVSGTPLTGAPAQPFTADGAGQVQIIYTSSPTSSTNTGGTDTITACFNPTCSSATETDSYTYAQSASASQSTLVANPTSVPADGTATSLITLTLLSATSSPVPGKTVTLTGNAGTSSTITPVVCGSGGTAGTTNPSGQACWRVKDSTAESVVYTAHDTTDSITVTQTPLVKFEPADAAQSSVVADFPLSFSQPAANDGLADFPIWVTIKDADGTPMNSQSVLLKAGSGSSQICAPVGLSCVVGTTGKTLTTNTSGQVEFTVFDTANDTSVVYTATDTTSAPNVVVTQTATMNFGGATPAKFAGLNSITVTPAGHGLTSSYGVTFTSSATGAAFGLSSSINLYFAPGTTLPSAVGNYSIADQTRSATATVTGITTGTYTPASPNPDSYSTVGISLSCVGCAIGDKYLVTISGVTNPPAALGPFYPLLWTSSDPDIDNNVFVPYTIS